MNDTKADPTKTHVAAEWKHASPLIACRFDPQGRYAFASAEDNKVLRWDAAAKAVTELAAHDSWVFSLAVSADGQTLVSGGGDGRLIWWPAADEQPKPLRTIEAHKGWIRELAISPDGGLLASAGNDHVVRLWNMADGAPVAEFAGHEAHVYSLTFHPQGEFLLSGDLKGQVRQWNIKTGKSVRTFDAKALHSYNGGQGIDFGGVRALAVSADSRFLACGGLHKATNPLGAVHAPLVLLFDWESQKLVQSHVAEGLKTVVWRVLFHPDGYLIGVAGGGSGGFLLFWKPAQAKEFHRFKLPNLARDFDLHADGLQVLTAHYDRKLRISKMAAKPA